MSRCFLKQLQKTSRRPNDYKLKTLVVLTTTRSRSLVVLTTTNLRSGYSWVGTCVYKICESLTNGWQYFWKSIAGSATSISQTCGEEEMNTKQDQPTTKRANNKRRIVDSMVQTCEKVATKRKDRQTKKQNILRRKLTLPSFKTLNQHRSPKTGRTNRTPQLNQHGLQDGC